MSPKWLHVVILPDGKVWFSLNQTHAVEQSESACGRWLKVAFEHEHEATIFVPEARALKSARKTTT